jgi:NAD(P)H-dependent flavin oxidoreductase YrpB (nitropropane dioxygenase family)
MSQFSPTPDGFLDLLRRQIVVAPMAGGPSTVGLVIAAARAGALGFLGRRSGVAGVRSGGLSFDGYLGETEARQ